MGLLGGALAGAVIGNAVAKHSGAPKTAAPAAAPVAQVVETGALDANGCYRQTVKEPVPGNAKLYTETVHLICPNRPAVGHAHPVVVPVQVVPAAAPAPIPAVSAAHGFNATANNATQVLVVPAGAAPVLAAAPAAAPAPAQPASVSYVPVVPVAPAQQPAGPAQVILLSKTVRKQKSAAASINISHALLILLVFYCIIRHL